MPPPPSPPNNIKNVVVSKHLSQQVKVYSYRVHKIQHCWRRRGKEVCLSPIVLSAPLTFDLVCSLLLLNVCWCTIYPSFITRSEEEADENKEGGSAINLVARDVKCCVEDILEFRATAVVVDHSDSLAWSSSEDNGWDRFGPGEFPFVCRPVLGLDGPGKDKFLLSEESIQRLRHVTLKDPASPTASCNYTWNAMSLCHCHGHDSFWLPGYLITDNHWNMVWIWRFC